MFNVSDPSGSYTHLSTDLPLPTGTGVARGAISQELDTGKVYRYSSATSTWYVIQGATATGGTSGAPGSPDSGPGAGTASLVSDRTTQALLEESRDLLRAIAHGIALLNKDLTLDDLIDQSNEV